MAFDNMLLLVLSVCLAHVYGHIPMHYDNWAEPDAAVYAIISDRTTASIMNSLARLTSIRDVMSQRQVDAYVVPTADAHGSQYIADADARREWLSGLSGSSGTAVVTSSRALVWTDNRYFTQFDMQVNTTYWDLMRQGTDLSIQAWLAANLSPASVVAVDPTTYTRSAWNTLETALREANITLRLIDDNLVDIARANIGDPAPERPSNPLILHTLDFTGKRSRDKISELFTQITARGASALVLTALDDIAYTLNLRGTDIPFNPVFFAYLVLRADLATNTLRRMMLRSAELRGAKLFAAPNNVILFWNNGVLSDVVEQHLLSENTQIQVRPYADIFNYLRNYSNQLPGGSTIWLSSDGSHAIFSAAEGDGNTNILSTISPVVLVKCVKNEVELAGFRSAHVKDGTAVVRFLRWVHVQVAAGANVTEVNCSDKLEELRAEELHFMGPSFATIAGAGSNGAVIHYKPEREGPQRVVAEDDMLLVDSGGQYRDGTTDITRTRHMSGTPTPEQRLAFTRVLKGQILMGSAVFPKGIVGHRLETLARKALWDVGLNYGHGTGHGLGHYLNVHEGPSWILSGPSPTDPGIVAGMIFSNEPGYYKVDEYGIRHEDVVEVIEMTRTADHILADGLVGDFDGAGALGFYTISLAPHQAACLDVNLLTDFELKYLNDYHARVFNTIGPILLQRNLTEDYEWLEKECAPIQRSAAIATSPTVILILSAFSLWLKTSS